MALQFGFGSGILWATRNDSGVNTPVRLGALQDVTIDFAGEVKELFGQFQFPIDTARGKHKITGKAKIASFSAYALNSLYFGQTYTVPSVTLAVINEAVTSTSGATPTATVAHAGATVVDLGIRYASTGNFLTHVSASPTTGQYSFLAGVYTLATGDATTNFLIDYIYTVTTVGAGADISGTNPLMGAAPRFQAVFNDQYENNQITLILYSCVATKFSLPTKLDDYMYSDFEFAAYQAASSQVFDLSMTQP
jgi:hypothetical protein